MFGLVPEAVPPADDSSGLGYNPVPDRKLNDSTTQGDGSDDSREAPRESERL
jgi:hypothetical protein